MVYPDIILLKCIRPQYKTSSGYNFFIPLPSPPPVLQATESRPEDNEPTPLQLPLPHLWESNDLKKAFPLNIADQVGTTLNCVDEIGSDNLNVNTSDNQLDKCRRWLHNADHRVGRESNTSHRRSREQLSFPTAYLRGRPLVRMAIHPLVCTHLKSMSPRGTGSFQLNPPRDNLAPDQTLARAGSLFCYQFTHNFFIFCIQTPEYFAKILLRFLVKSKSVTSVL